MAYGGAPIFCTCLICTEARLENLDEYGLGKLASLQTANIPAAIPPINAQAVKLVATDIGTWQ